MLSFFVFFSLFAPVKKHLYCSLLGWSNDFWHSVIYSWSTQRLNNGNINLPLNGSFWAFPCYLKQDGQSVWWSLLVFLCCLKQDGQSVWWSLLVFLWFCPRQELKWSVTYVSETDFVFCVGYRLSAKPVFTSLECPSEIISVPDVKGECVRRTAGSRWLWCQMELVLTVTLMWNGMGVDRDFVKWNGWWQWLWCKMELEWVLTVTLVWNGTGVDISLLAKLHHTFPLLLLAMEIWCSQAFGPKWCDISAFGKCLVGGWGWVRFLFGSFVF